MTISAIKPIILLVGTIFLISASVWAEEFSKNDKWHFELKPLYFWSLSLEGDTTMEPAKGGPGGTSNLDEAELTSAFSLHFEAGKGDWTVFTDYLYAQYTANDINISTSPVQGNNELTAHLAELGVAYLLSDESWYKLEILGGVRYMYIENKFDFYNDNLNTLSANGNVWDGFGGIRLTGIMTDSLTATVRADVGGGNSDLVWNAVALVNWRYLHWGSIFAGYRVLDYKVSNGPLAFDLQAKGPVIGLSFHW